MNLHVQQMFQVPVKGGRQVVYNHPIGSRKNVYISYIPGIYCLLEDYIIPTTYYQNQKHSMTWQKRKLQLKPGKTNGPNFENQLQKAFHQTESFSIYCGTFFESYKKNNNKTTCSMYGIFTHICQKY